MSYKVTNLIDIFDNCYLDLKKMKSETEFYGLIQDRKEFIRFFYKPVIR